MRLISPPDFKLHYSGRSRSESGTLDNSRGASMKQHETALLLSTLFACFISPVFAASETELLLEQAIAGNHREAKNVARDVYRHPQETLLFFGLKPGMTVV